MQNNFYIMDLTKNVVKKVVNVAEKFGIKTKEVKKEDLEQKVAITI